MRQEARAILSDRQIEIAVLISRGLQDKQIAEELRISTSTVDHHLRKAFRILGVHTRAEFVFRCFATDGGKA